MTTSLLDHLPHREPFRFLSAVRDRTAGESATGVWTVTGREPFFAGHFPCDPIVPGVLITEALAQLAGLVGADGPGPDPARLARVDVKFLGTVRPPADIELVAKLVRSFEGLWMFSVEAHVASARVADGSLVLATAGGRA